MLQGVRILESSAQRVPNPPPGLDGTFELSLGSRNGSLLECGQCLDLRAEVCTPRHFGPLLGAGRGLSGVSFPFPAPFRAPP